MPAAGSIEHCQALAEFYLPKGFAIAALFLGEHWELKALEKKLLVPAFAESLEELWPYIPDFFKESEFKATWGFLIALSFAVGPRAKVSWDQYQQKKRSENLGGAPDTSQAATTMPASPASSATSGSPESANVI